MKKLLVICPNPADSTSFWRGVGPFSQLQAPGWQIQYFDRQRDGELDWHTLATCDALFFQRANHASHKIICEIAKSFNRPLWVDYDDDLFSVPLSNPTSDQYNNPSTVESLKAILAMADHVSVTTEWLSDQLKAHTTAPITVVPNAWNDALHPFEHKPFKYHRRFFWRGGPTHNEDIDEYLDELEKVYREFSEWEWFFLGFPSYKVKKIIPENRYGILSRVNLVKYYNVLKSLECSVGLVPLADNTFNRSKSNIAWLEATYGGAACIGPNWDEWKYNGMINYYAPHKNLYETVCKHMPKLKDRYDESYATIKEKLLLSTVNQTRLGILQSLGK